MNILDVIAREMSLPLDRVAAVVDLLDSGATVPFIARYRKERTGSMDDQTLRALSERLERLRALDKRRAEILRLIDEQQALTPELSAKIAAADTLAALEDLYRPYRQSAERAPRLPPKWASPLSLRCSCSSSHFLERSNRRRGGLSLRKRASWTLKLR